MRSQIGPKWTQNGSKVAPRRLLGGPGALPGGFREALGRRGRCLSDFGDDFGHRFGSKKSLRTIEKRAPVLNCIFCPPEAFWDSCGVDVGVICGCFLAAQPRSGQNRENHEKVMTL